MQTHQTFMLTKALPVTDVPSRRMQKDDKLASPINLNSFRRSISSLLSQAMLILLFPPRCQVNNNPDDLLKLLDIYTQHEVCDDLLCDIFFLF